MEFGEEIPAAIPRQNGGGKWEEEVTINYKKAETTIGSKRDKI